MAKKKLKRRKPIPKPEPEAKKEAKKDSSILVSKGKVARLHHENEKWFPVSESVASSKEFNKIKGRLTKTKRASRGA